MTKAIVNLDFCSALRAAAARHGDTAMVETCDRAHGEHRAADDVGAIMHGATWWPCATCGGRGRVGRCKCKACGGTGTRVEQRHLDALRAEALAEIGVR